MNIILRLYIIFLLRLSITVADSVRSLQNSPRPVVDTSAAPSSSPTSDRPTTILLPIDFDTSVIPTDNDFPAVLDTALEEYILQRFQEQFQNDTSINIFSVEVDVLRLNRVRRSLQEIFDVRVVGQSVLQVRGNTETKTEQARTFLNSITTPNGVQQALINAGSDLKVPSAQLEQEGGGDEGPNTAETIIGFTIVGLALLSLLYWVRVLYRKRQKRLKKKKLEEVRKMQTYVIANPAAQAARASPARKGAIAPQPQIAVTRPITRDDDSDAFGRELERAVELDEMEWEEHQRYKMELETRSRSMESRSVNSTGSPLIVPERNVTSFPYGDETGRQMSQAPYRSPQRRQNRDAESIYEAIELTLDDAVGTSPTAISSKYDPQGPPEFDIYGDEKKTSLRDSWDLDKHPVVDQEGPSQYSFVYPMRRQKISDVQNHRASPSSEPSEDALAVRGSPTVSSWSTMAGFTRASGQGKNTRGASVDTGRSDREGSGKTWDSDQTIASPGVAPEAAVIEDLPDSDSDGSGDSVTSESFKLSKSLLEEVERLSKFVKTYENKKTTANSTRLSQASLYSTARESRSEDVSDLEVIPTASGESEISHRLGIQRFNAQDDLPPAMLMGMQEYKPSDYHYSNNARRSPDEDASKPSPPRRTQMNEVERKAGAAAMSTIRAKESMNQSYEKEMDEVNQNSLSQLPFDEAEDILQIPRRSPPPGEPPSLRTPKRTDPKPKSSPQPSSKPKVQTASSSPKVKSKNSGFNNIVSMFESKPKTAVVPPNANWQYEK